MALICFIYKRWAALTLGQIAIPELHFDTEDISEGETYSMFIEPVMIEFARAATQVITGRFLTNEQIRLISKNAVGAYFSDWLPTPKDEVEAKKRVEQARLHITEASYIISGLQNDLDNQAKQLDQIIREIEEKKKVVDHYTTLAETNQKAFGAFKVEMEEAIRKQLQAETEKGKRARQIVSFAFWVITLVLGAALGAYFIPLVGLIRSWLNT